MKRDERSFDEGRYFERRKIANMLERHLRTLEEAAARAELAALILELETIAK